MMTKQSGLSIRINTELRNSFTNWCKENNLKGSEFLRGIIEGCVMGKISPQILADLSSQSLDNTAIQKVNDLEAKVRHLSSQLEGDSLVKSQDLSSQIKSIVSSQVETIKEELYKQLDKKIDNVQEEMFSQMSSYLNRHSDVNITIKETQPINYFGKDDEALSENEDDVEVVRENKKPSESRASVTSNNNGVEKIGSYEEAIATIKELHQQDKNYAEIVKVLTGKYLTATGKTNWSGTQVSRIVKQKDVQ